MLTFRSSSVPGESGGGGQSRGSPSWANEHEESAPAAASPAAARPPGRFVLASPSAGSGFPTVPFNFTVHSIFRSALNLRIAANLPIVSLIADPRYAHPRGVVVPCARFDAWSLATGDEGTFDGNCLSFSVAGTPRVLIDPSRSDSEERPPVIPISEGLIPALAQASTLVLASRKERGSPPIFLGTELKQPDDPFTPILRSAAIQLVLSFYERSLSAALIAAEMIIGLGPGLTPAGDDFLCGFMAANRALSRPDDPDDHFLNNFGRGVGTLLRRTNEISAAFLASAAEGRFSASLVSFAEAVRIHAALAGSGKGQAKTGEVLPGAVSALSSIGHSSGLDAAEGFLYGFSTEDLYRHGNQA